MLGTLGEHALEAHSGNLATNVVAVDERRVACNGRLLSEELLNLGTLFLDVKGERFLIGQRREAVAVGLGEELHATSLCQFLQLGNDLRSMVLQLFYAGAREAECDLEILAVLCYHLLQRVKCRHVGALGNIGDATLVLVVIVIVMIGTDVEETVALQMDNLMYLKI